MFNEENFALLDDLSLLESEITNRISSCKDKCPVLIIDDLSALNNYGHDLTAVVKFMLSIERFLDGIGSDTTFIRLLHADTYERDKQVKLMIDWAMNSSHYVISTCGLSSGHSNDIDGVLTVSRGPRFAFRTTTVKEFVPRSVHYKVIDTEVKLIGKGLSSAVL